MYSQETVNHRVSKYWFHEGTFPIQELSQFVTSDDGGVDQSRGVELQPVVCEECIQEMDKCGTPKAPAMDTAQVRDMDISPTVKFSAQEDGMQTEFDIGSDFSHGVPDLRAGVSHDMMEDFMRVVGHTQKVNGAFVQSDFVFTLSSDKIRDHTSWSLTSYKRSYSTYKWPYKWVTGVITLHLGVTW